MTVAGPAPTYEDWADELLAAAAQPLPAPVRAAAVRTLYNVLVVALGARRHVDVRQLEAALPEAPGGVAAMPGSGRPVAPADAALLTGFAGHYDDFDDTHLATVIHPGAAGLGAAWAETAGGPFDGAALLTAFAVGCEAQLRLGLAVSPEHYDRGWHITGTCGVVGAAVTAALLGRASRAELAAALRLASVRTLGHREAFGTQLKPLHAGLAAAAGHRAARAATEVNGGAIAAELLDTGPLLRALAPGGAGALLGTGTWALLDNTFKPYPCGIVAHPGIDAAVEAHAQLGGDWASVRAVRYRCHPLVPELMGRAAPADGLQARFSAVHGVAAGLRDGRVGLSSYTDAAANDPALAALRALITMSPDPELGRAEAELVITTDSGPVRSHVQHARGSLARPLTDTELRAKGADLTTTADALWAFVAGLAGPTTWPIVPEGEDGADRPGPRGRAPDGEPAGVTARLARFAAHAAPPPDVLAAATALTAGPTRGVGSAQELIGRAVAAVTGPGDALAVGWEVGVRVHALLDGHVEGGWDPFVPAILAGVAAGAARRVGAGPERVTAALGIALTQAGSFAALAGTALAGTALGADAHGHAADRGAQAVRLALAGVTAPATAIEGRRGLVALLAPGADLAVVAADLGERWRCAGSVAEVPA
jgi:2-methylcitrate dehydratase PrpD